MSEPSATYLESYARSNDLTPEGRRFKWPIYRKLFLPLLPGSRAVRILDFGCGPGQLLEWIAAEGYKAEGIDTDASQIEFAQSIGVKAHLVHDSNAWLANAGAFDVIFMSDVLEHIPDEHVSGVLRQLHSSLSPQGVLIVRVPNATSSFGSHYRYIDPTHYRSFTSDSLWFELNRNGFKQVRVISTDVWVVRSFRELIAACLRKCFHGIRRLEAISEFGMGGSKLPLSQTIVAIAKKTDSQ